MLLRIERTFIALCCVLWLLLQQASPLYAQRSITPEEWQQLTSDRAFSYRNEVEHIKPPEVHTAGFLERFLAFLFRNNIGQVLSWIFVVAAVLFIVYKIFLSGDSFLFDRKAKSLNAGADRIADSDDIEGADWDVLLHKAIGENDLRLAVRYTYMRLLQLLQQRELISYRSDKTNHEYYAELKDAEQKQAFRQLSRRYEYTWYGQYTISQEQYSEYRQLFDKVKRQLGV